MHCEFSKVEHHPTDALLVSIEMVRFSEMFDESAAAPGGGARGGEAGLGAARRDTGPLVPMLTQVGIRPVHVILSVAQQQSSSFRPSVQVRVRSGRAFVSFHFGGFRIFRTVRRFASLYGRHFSVVKLVYVSSGCVILYFTER